jgi:ATP-dependent RNA circularization protein (DNA/RNA ligase family)
MLLVTNPKIRSMILTPFLTPITSDTIDGVITAFLEHRRNWVIVNEVTGDQNPKPPAEV